MKCQYISVIAYSIHDFTLLGFIKQARLLGPRNANLASPFFCAFCLTDIQRLKQSKRSCQSQKRHTVLRRLWDIDKPQSISNFDTDSDAHASQRKGNIKNKYR